MELKNAKRHPKVYYCRHIEKGVCKYDKDVYLIQDDCLRRMMSTMAGIPVYVEDHQKVNLEKIQYEADGYVAECFYNELDGWFWAKFIAVSDAAHEAIERGYKVSNAYTVEAADEVGGYYHNMVYDKEVMAGKYTHLAIVEHPRYEETFIIDAAEYKEYNNKLKVQKELNNSKDKTGGRVMKFFKMKKEPVEKVDNETLVELANGKTVKVMEMIEAVETKEAEELKNEAEKAKMDAMVKVNGKEMTVKDLANKYSEVMKEKENACKNEDDDKEDKKKDDDKEEKKDKKNKDEDEGKEDKDEDKEKENSLSKEEKEKHFEELKNASDKKDKFELKDVEVDTMADKLKRGKERF